MSIIEQINEGIKESIRNRAQLRLDTLRMLKSKILAVDARATLADEEVIKLFKTYLGNLQEALEQAQAANRLDIADKLKEEILIVQEFLPKALSQEETKKIVEQAMIESAAKSKRDFGQVMKAVMKINSQVDGKMAKEIINQLLED